MTDGAAGIKLLAAVIGFWIVMRALNRDATGRTLADRLLGQSGSAAQTLPAVALPGSAGNPIVTPAPVTQAPQGFAGKLAGAPVQTAVNPIPGATGSRLDQGFDVTGKQFLSPYAGTVVASQMSDSGWAGGGYVAVANAANPSQVEYFAEGLSPLVSQGQRVTAGEAIARPSINPYNGIIGNIETGPANPANPLQPLAQVASNPAGVVTQFYDWLRGLGAPAASSTSLAGHP